MHVRAFSTNRPHFFMDSFGFAFIPLLYEKCSWRQCTGIPVLSLCFGAPDSALSQCWIKIITSLYSRLTLLLCLSVSVTLCCLCSWQVWLYDPCKTMPVHSCSVYRNGCISITAQVEASCLGCGCLWCLHFTIGVYSWLLSTELLLLPKVLSFTTYLAFPGNFRADELSQRSTRPNGRSFSLILNNQILQKCDYVRSSFQG